MERNAALSFGRRALHSAINGAARLVGRRIEEEDGAEVKSILVVELWNIGDVVLLLPFLNRLRNAFPGATITLLARPHARAILDGSGLVDEYLDAAGAAANWLSMNPVERGWGDLWRLKSELRGRDFDMAFQCRPHVREHLILSMSGARRRIGVSFGKDDAVLTDAVPLNEGMLHKAENWLKLAEIVGVPVAAEPPAIRLSESERSEAMQFFEASGVDEKHVLVAVHPGASTASKRWPLERFAEVARVLSARAGTRVLAFVDPAGYGASLSDIEGVVVASKGLREMMALIAQCSLLVGNDSGPMHLAGALGVPTVAIFGAGIPQWFAPLGEGHEVVTSDDSASGQTGALGEIPVTKVIEAVDRILSRQSPDRPTS
jgi:ADP-heptose:LPS heptosyltransferase